MTKRKAEEPLQPASTPCPASRPTFIPPLVRLPYVYHCQPLLSAASFEVCMRGACTHCSACVDCRIKRELAWQNDHTLRAKVGSVNASLQEQADAYDRIAPSFMRDHEAYDHIFTLQDQVQALQQQVNELKQAQPNNSSEHSIEAQAVRQHDRTDFEARSSDRVRKYKSDPADRYPMNDLDPNLTDDKIEDAREVDDEQYDTAHSTYEDEQDEIILKREETPLDQFYLIDQIPSSGRYRQRQAMVVIDEEEQREAKLSFDEAHQREERAQRREQQRDQPPREVTLHTPRASTENAQPQAAGSLWTEEEDRKLRRGIKKKLTNQEICNKYLPNRNVEGIRKRRQKLAKVD